MTQIYKLLQLETSVQFQEFLEVHKSKSTKSAWVNDIVLPPSEKHRHKIDKNVESESHSTDVTDVTAVEDTGNVKKKLSDLEARNMLHCKVPL